MRPFWAPCHWNLKAYEKSLVAADVFLATSAADLHWVDLMPHLPRHEVPHIVAQKCDEAITHGDFDIRERGDLAYCLLNATSSGASILEAATTRKTTKMPDAPVLSDGKAVRFETWETIICQKLEANSDHYPLPVHRNLYVQSRCEGKAPLPIAT
ncbi:hypothetical protein N7491_002640 [Penicillium cf. griseofulvum]|nr:hypothetical protein N7491_002640 [Penicillium cf. griseofulvum]KAJ5448297.1 hypothetical protein N7445_003118 [Penicillium cf. griseofulvum]